MNFGSETRVIVNRVDAEHKEDSFVEDVKAGLSSRQKFFQPKHIYDDMGSILFEAICHLPEYYVTRVETEIVKRFCTDITNALPGPLTLIEAGSGSAMKTRILIEAILQQQPSLQYMPMDVSYELLTKSAAELTAMFPTLQVTAYAGDYFHALQQLKEVPTERKLVLFLGTSLGNFEPPDDLHFLSTLRSILRPGEGTILGLDLKKPASILEQAYDDALGVTAAFNLNLLNRLNREVGANFNLRHFGHRATYNDELGRVEMHLVSRCAQTVSIRQWELELHFDEGETIYTHSSYKYDQQQVQALAGQTGFTCQQTWQDDESLFSLNLLVAQ